MSAALPVLAQQLEPGAECTRCASQPFPEQKGSRGHAQWHAGVSALP